MKKNFKKLISISFSLILLIIVSSFNSLEINTNSVNTQDSEKELEFQETRLDIEDSYFDNDANPIHIDATGAQDWSWASGQPWCFGAGTIDDPYRIENLTIDAIGSEYGIKIENSQNAYFRIKNCTISHVKSGSQSDVFGGILLISTSKGELIKNNCSNNYKSGIIFQQSDGNSIFDNFLDNNSHPHIILDHSDYNTIENNTLKNNHDSHGILLQNSDNNLIKYNMVNNSDVIGIFLMNSEENEVLKNEVNYNKWISAGSLGNIGGGIAISYGTKNLIEENEVLHNDGHGITLVSTSYNTIENNLVKYNIHDGIYSYDSINNDYIENIASNNSGNGIYLNESSYEEIILNTVNNNTYGGIYLYDSDNNDVIANNVSYNEANSVSIFGNAHCDYNTIARNILFKNKIGVYLIGFIQGNWIKGNEIANNTDYGVYNGFSMAANNQFIKNAFIGNKIHAWELSTSNNWYVGIIGNYWDNYTGRDTNYDGIGDVPHTIYLTQRVKDMYPLFNDPIHRGETIHIDENQGGGALNWSKTKQLKAWCNGSGTEVDPYVIDYLTINAQNASDCILIGNSSAHFIIEHCELTNSSKAFDPPNSVFYGGIQLKNVFNGTLKNIELEKVPIGILLLLSEDIVAEENYINDSFHRNIAVWHCEDVEIVDNTLMHAENELGGQNTASSIQLMYTNDSNIEANEIKFSTWGIFLQNDANDNTIDDNDITNCEEVGILLHHTSEGGCGNNVIEDNLIDNCGDYGIFLADLDEEGLIHDTTIEDNDIKNNNIGLMINSSCKDNLVYNNNFSGNSINAMDNGTNNDWYFGTTGNIWDDYSGEDKNDNGRGDQPYDISGTAGSQDLYPIFEDGPDAPPPPPPSYYAFKRAFEAAFKRAFGNAFKRAMEKRFRAVLGKMFK